MVELYADHHIYGNGLPKTLTPLKVDNI